MRFNKGTTLYSYLRYTEDSYTSNMHIRCLYKALSASKSHHIFNVLLRDSLGLARGPCASLRR
jgi:hypothetical protein